MPLRTQTFDGKDYPDAASSDPTALGWMQGTPPPQDKRIRFEDDKFFSFPQIRWSLSHMRELVPTVNVWRGAGAASDLGTVNSGTAAAIDALTFKDMNGQTRNWADSLADTYTDSIVVLHKGKRVYERYIGAMQPPAQHLAHACFSITKSYAATLAAMLLHEGVLDETKLVPFYLPEMASTAYADATLRQVLDMQIGVAYSEVYSDPKAQIWDYARAGGFRARAKGYSGPDNLYDFLLTLKKEGEHGQAFAYKTVNTELVCWIMKRVTGLALADHLSERIWSRIGCEQDAYVSVDSIGVAFGGGGKLAADPGDGGIHRALVTGLAFGSKVTLPALAGVEPLHHRAHEGEVADVQFAVAGGTHASAFWLPCVRLGRCGFRAHVERPSRTSARCACRPSAGRCGRRPAPGLGPLV